MKLYCFQINFDGLTEIKEVEVIKETEKKYKIDTNSTRTFRTMVDKSEIDFVNDDDYLFSLDKEKGTKIWNERKQIEIQCRLKSIENLMKQMIL